MIQRSTLRRDWRASGCNGHSLLLAPQTVRCPLIEPGEENPKREADGRSHDDPSHQPLGNVEERKDLRRHLHQEPRARGIKRCRAKDVAPPQFGKEVHPSSTWADGKLSATIEDQCWRAPDSWLLHSG